MKTEVKGKSVVIDRQPAVLYSSLSDLRTLVSGLPDDKKQMITATEDTISANVQGISLGLKVAERVPFSRVVMQQDGQSPFEFAMKLCFDTVDGVSQDADCRTSFHIELSAELNMMLKMMLGGKLQGLVDSFTDMVADAASGKPVNLQDFQNLV